MFEHKFKIRYLAPMISYQTIIDNALIEVDVGAHACLQRTCCAQMMKGCRHAEHLAGAVLPDPPAPLQCDCRPLASSCASYLETWLLFIKEME